MPTLFTFAAYSGTGKTTYIEKLISELAARGVRVGAIKNDGHDVFEMDKPGKDSFRFREAGAQVVALRSPTRAMIMSYAPLSAEEIMRNMQNVDIVISEGYMAGSKNNICLYRAESGNGLKLPPEECIAVVTDTPLDTGETPQFPLDNPASLADFIVEKCGLGNV